MSEQKRDQRPFDLVQKHLSGLLINTILSIVEEMGEPYQLKPGLGGLKAYSPKAMTVIYLILNAESKTYRKMVGYLENNPSIIKKLGLTRIPSKNTIWRTGARIPESYLRELNLRITREVTAGSLAADSTGYSNNRFVRWFSIRHDEFRRKRGWVKLHAIISIPTRVIVDYEITDWKVSDIEGLRQMLDRIACGTGFFCLDSAYLARDLCDWIVRHGMMPRIKPKSNTVCKNNGSQAWGDMLRKYRDDRDGFMDEYNQRSIIEAVFGAIKTMYGNHLRSIRRDRQRREIAARVICYNIEVVAREKIRKGRLTSELIATLAA